jgi:hypothetical protein
LKVPIPADCPSNQNWYQDEDDDGALVELYWQGGLTSRDRNLSQCHTVPQNSHADCTDMKLLTMQFSPVSCHFLPLRSKHCTSLSTPFSLQHPQPVSPSQWQHQVSHPYKTTGNITVLYVLLFIFLSNQTEKCCHLQNQTTRYHAPDSNNIRLYLLAQQLLLCSVWRSCTADPKQ